MEKIIGTLNETAIHSALKFYCEPDTVFHEVDFLGYVVDVMREEKIYEIQSRSFYKLKKKLAAFIASGCSVTVVYPMIRKKRLVRIDAETGEVVGSRTSPKSVKLPDLFRELVYITDFLLLPNFSVLAVSLDAEQYQRSDAKKIRGKPLDRLDVVPTEILEAFHLASAADYRSLLPADKLPEEFTSSDLAAALGCRIDCARSMLLVLRKIGIVEKITERDKKTRMAVFRILTE